MTDTHTLDSVQPETADLLIRTAESKGVTVDRLLRGMLVTYTSIELRHVSEDIQRVLEMGTLVREAGNTTEEEQLCPYCYCASVAQSTGSVSGYGIYRCESEYCSLDMFVEPAGSEQNPDLRMVTGIIDVNSRWDRNG
ncbi:MAG: hypothetical protein ACI9HI_000809 [Salinirussus sp.]|jgi:hypothetical protein